jgi:hypothetical protein
MPRLYLLLTACARGIFTNHLEGILPRENLEAHNSGSLVSLLGLGLVTLGTVLIRHYPHS